MTQEPTLLGYGEAPKPRDLLIREAMSRGLTGFVIPGVSNGISDVLLNVDTFDKALCQRWLISLGAWRYRAGTLFQPGTWPGGITFDQIIPAPDNQIQSVSPNYKALLTWGAGGVSEQAVMDYPTRGLTVAVTACSVRLQLQNTGLSGGVYPVGNQSGWLAPADVSRDSVIQPPTFTSPLRFLNAPGVGGSCFIDVPARGVGYRPYLPGTLTTYYNIGQNFFQCDGAGIRIKTDVLNWGGTSAPAQIASSHLAGNELPWYPLHPATQCIECNTASTTQQGVILQFVLDIS